MSADMDDGVGTDVRVLDGTQTLGWMDGASQ